MPEHLLDRFRDTRTAAAIVLLCSVVILAIVFAMQYLGGLTPCPLCITQRWPYGAAIVFAGAAAVPGTGQGVRRALLGLAGLALVVTAGIGFYHAGVEMKVFAGPQSCAGTISATTIDELRAQLRAAPMVRCDEVPWSLFGISLAGWNFIVASGLAAFSLGVAARPAPERSLRKAQDRRATVPDA